MSHLRDLWFGRVEKVQENPDYEMINIDFSERRFAIQEQVCLFLWKLKTEYSMGC